MTVSISQASQMREAFEKIEESYEFMLAYAAQGRKREVEEGAGGESQIRNYLKRFVGALGTLETALAEGGLGGPEAAPFAERMGHDIAVARSVLEILLARPSISSDMIDNTNGLIALRAFLTDVFFVDQAVLPAR